MRSAYWSVVLTLLQIMEFVGSWFVMDNGDNGFTLKRFIETIFKPNYMDREHRG